MKWLNYICCCIKRGKIEKSKLCNCYEKDICEICFEKNLYKSNGYYIL